MNSEQKKRLKKELIDSTGIAYRVSEFRSFNDRFHTLTKNTGFRNVLVEQVHKLERKFNELQIGGLGAPAAAAAAGIGGLTAEEIEEAKKGKAIVDEILTIVSRMGVDIKVRFDDFARIHERILLLESEHRQLPAGASEEERERKLRRLVKEIIDMVGNYVSTEDDSANKLRAINAKILEYRKWVQELKARGLIARYKLIKRGIYDLLYPRWLEGESDEFNARTKTIYFEHINDIKAEMLEILNELYGTGPGIGRIREQHDAADDRIKRLRALFGAPGLGNELNYDEFARKMPKDRNILMDQKVDELEMIREAMELSTKLKNTTKELDKIISLKTF